MTSHIGFPTQETQYNDYGESSRTFSGFQFAEPYTSSLARLTIDGVDYSSTTSIRTQKDGPGNIKLFVMTQTLWHDQNRDTLYVQYLIIFFLSFVFSVVVFT